MRQFAVWSIQKLFEVNLHVRIQHSTYPEEPRA